MSLRFKGCRVTGCGWVGLRIQGRGVLGLGPGSLGLLGLGLGGFKVRGLGFWNAVGLRPPVSKFGINVLPSVSSAQPNYNTNHKTLSSKPLQGLQDGIKA